MEIEEAYETLRAILDQVEDRLQSQIIRLMDQISELRERLNMVSNDIENLRWEMCYLKDEVDRLERDRGY